MKKIIFIVFLAILFMANLSSNAFASTYEFTFDRTYLTPGDILDKLPHWSDGFWGTMTLSDAGDDVYFNIDLIDPTGGTVPHYAVDEFWLNYIGAGGTFEPINVIIGATTISGVYSDGAIPTRDGYYFDLTSNDLGSRDEPLSGYLSLPGGGNLDPEDFIIGSNNVTLDELLYAGMRIQDVNLWDGPGSPVPAGGGGQAWIFASEAAPVPEPATMLLLGSGLLGLAGFGRKKFFKK